MAAVTSSNMPDLLKGSDGKWFFRSAVPVSMASHMSNVSITGKVDDLPIAAKATTNGTGLHQQPSTEASNEDLELLAKLEEQNR